jgi:hypothetical protein
MALTSSKGFFYKKHLKPSVEAPATLTVLIANSAGPLTLGDAVQLTSGYLTIAATTESVLGILVGIVDANGRNVFQQGVSVTGTKAGDDTYTAASDNQTVDQVKGVVIVDEDALFLNEADSTLTQAEIGTYFDTTSDSNQVTGSGSGTISQFQLIELVTTNSEGAAEDSQGLFRISQSQIGWAAS